MREFSIDLAAEQISDLRTKDYFQEVLGSFINGNYRSAVVMLWSVVVADFVYKCRHCAIFIKMQRQFLSLMQLKLSNKRTQPVPSGSLSYLRR